MGGVHVGPSHPPPPSHRRPPCPACARRPGREAEGPPDTIPCGPSSPKALEYMAQLGLPSVGFCRGLNRITSLGKRLSR